MNQLSLIRRVNPKANCDIPDHNSLGQLNLENPNQAQPTRVTAEVEKLKQALAETKANEKIRLREIKTLIERSFRTDAKADASVAKRGKSTPHCLSR